jgi:hypothetical protein
MVVPTLPGDIEHLHNAGIEDRHDGVFKIVSIGGSVETRCLNELYTYICCQNRTYPEDEATAGETGCSVTIPADRTLDSSIAGTMEVLVAQIQPVYVGTVVQCGHSSAVCNYLSNPPPILPRRLGN